MKSVHERTSKIIIDIPNPVAPSFNLRFLKNLLGILVGNKSTRFNNEAEQEMLRKAAHDANR